MKKSTFFLIILAALALLSACETDAENGPEGIDDPVDIVVDDPPIQIGFSLAGEGDFYKQLTIDIEQLCERLNYTAGIMTAASAEQQQRDIRSMISKGAQIIVIDPVNGDMLESVLAECESDDVHVVSILREINGIYSTLISVDYKYIGEQAAKHASTLFAQQEEGGRCLILRSDYNSCASQLLSDGFIDVADDDPKLTLVSETLGGGEEEAYKITNDIIDGEGVNFIFAQNAEFARGALRAAYNRAKKIYIVVYGGEMDLIKSVASGGIEMALFGGTKELAEYSMGVANEFINSATYEPVPYMGLTVNIATSENAADFISESLLTAQVSE